MTLFPLLDGEITSAALIERLCAIAPRHWAEFGRSGKPMTQNKLARLLKPLGVGPILIGSNRLAGYRMTQFADAFERYLKPLTTLLNLSSSHSPINPGDSEDMATSRSETAERFENLAKSSNHNEKRAREDWHGEVRKTRRARMTRGLWAAEIGRAHV